MPLIYYSCECGHSMNKFFRQVQNVPAFFICEKCNNNAKKTLKAPNSTSIIVIDNGVQARKVEVNLEIVEDIKNRSTKDFKDK